MSPYTLLKWCTLNQVLFYLSMAQNSVLLGHIFCPQEDLFKLGYLQVLPHFLKTDSKWELWLALRKWHWTLSYGTVGTSASISGKRGSGSEVDWKWDKIKDPETKIGLITWAEWESGKLEGEDNNKNPRTLETLEGSVDFILTAREILRNVHKGVMSFRNHLAYIWRSGVEEKGEEEVVFFSRSFLTVKRKPKVLQNRKSFFSSKEPLCLYSYRFLNILKNLRTF